MSRHDGVSCDSCLKSNFGGSRYKCLICYDYDLCSTCYEAGVTTTRHSGAHPMQCILTRDLLDLFYGGDAAPASSSSEGPRRPRATAASLSLSQSFTCPLCTRLGFTEAALAQHTASQHADSTQEVVCPICAAKPHHNSNLVTDDFAAHVNMEHDRIEPRRNETSGSEAAPDLISFLNSPSGGPSSSSAYRPAPSAGRNATVSGAGDGASGGGQNASVSAAARARRLASMHNPHPPSSLMGRLFMSSFASRETADPISELLSQLSSVRRSANAEAESSSQFQQLETPLDLDRQQEQLESASAAARARLGYPTATSAPSARYAMRAAAAGSKREPPKSQSADADSAGPDAAGTEPSRGNPERFLLRQCSDEESERSPALVSRHTVSQFVQELVLSTLIEPPTE